MSEKHEMFEELDAWNPRWQDLYPSLRAAVFAEGSQVLKNLYHEWLLTPEGVKYTAGIAAIRDYKGEIEAAQRAEEESVFFRQSVGRLNAQANAGKY